MFTVWRETSIIDIWHTNMFYGYRIFQLMLCVYYLSFISSIDFSPCRISFKKIDRGKDEEPMFSELWQKLPFEVNCMRFTMNLHRPVTLKLNANKWISTIRYNQSTIQWESEEIQWLKSAYLNLQINSISFIKITLWQVVLNSFRMME